ncbi:MAG: PAS domain S-box protein [Deltaproteobacteria bacterium]|nr:PAS domain S-box protein [Deltaproteobacteria bacterium]
MDAPFFDDKINSFRNNGLEASPMVPKPTYEELENRVNELASEVFARKQAEKALRESEERFKQLAEQSRTIAWEVNSDGLYTYISHLSGQILGYHPEEIIGKIHFYDLHPEEGREAFKAAAFEVFARKESFVNLVNVVQTKTGTCVWMSTNGIPLLNPDGTLRGYRGSDTDITERKKTLEAIKASGRFLQNIFDGIQDGISVLDQDLTIIRCNFRIEDWYAEHMPLVGKKCYRVYQGLDSPCPWCPSIRAMKTGDVHSEIVPYPSAEKPSGWIELSSFPLRNENGEVVNVIEHVKDITAKMQAEEELRAERERLRVLSENAPFGMAMIDRDGTFKYINIKFKEIFGYDLSDIPNGRTWFNKAYPDPDYRHQAIAAWLEDLAYSQVGQKRPREFEVECKDGSKKIFNFISVELETGENLMACEDITSRKEAETALKNSEAKYRNIFDNAQAAIFRTRISDGKVLECNDRFAQAYGYDSREECIAHYLSTEHYVDPGTRDRMLTDIAKSGEVNDFEARFSRKDGSIVCIRFSARANPEEDFIEGVGYDITREKNAIEELRVSEEKYRSILESMEEGYYEVDIAGNLTFFN